MAAGGSRTMRMQITESDENIHAGQTFHERCGRRITLSNGNRTATRSVRDFSHALVFSAEPLVDDVLFEVVIEQKNLSWGGSIEIGVTTENPDGMDIPSCATVMRNGTWVMSGIDVRKDGMCLTEFYGTDLEMLSENDRVGVMRTSNNELLFFVNGQSQGLAATNMPKRLWALVDLYGRCVQVSIYPNEMDSIADGSFNEDLNDQQSLANMNLPNCLDVNIDNANVFNNNNSILRQQHLCDANDFNDTSFMNTSGVYSSPIANATASSTASSACDCYDMNDHLRFHTRCGSLVKLSRSCRTAERCRPLDEFNNGVVMTHRPLRDNEMFEIRIDKLVDKWSGSIEVGVTTHNPSILHFPATMTNMRSGTIMMSGCGILTNGKGTRRQYGDFNLDELREGDRVGMMRKSSGSLYYYINGEDQGVAATRVASTLWGVIDLYGMTTKVTIVDHDGREQQNLITRRNNSSNLFNHNSNISNDLQNNEENNDEDCDLPVHPSNSNEFTPEMEVADTVYQAPEAQVFEENALRFHHICGSHATITNNGKTALRPNAGEDFNNGVVLTRRPLYNNELFEVRLEKVVNKWAGSVEIGVTTFSAEELEFPFTMTNVRSGTWMMTGNGVMQNGITIVEQYGENLDRLQVGDRVGVIRKENGTLHFLVNGIDQGPAATNIPEEVYGVIDLYGQAAQASIADHTDSDSPDIGNSTISNTTLYSDTPLKFHEIHGANVIITNNGLTASRPNSLAEFNNAVVFSNRPLKQRELFEVIIDNVVRHWSGNIEIGVTGCRPEDVVLTANATEIDADDTVILCGPLTFHNRRKIHSNIRTDIDTLRAGSHVGVMRIDNFIHFYVNGIDQGSAAECHSPYVWAIVDLYGQCAQVTIKYPVIPDQRAPYATSENSQSYPATSIIQNEAIQQSEHRWTCISGNAILTRNCTTAFRSMSNTGALTRCLLFSEHHLVVGCPFEIKIASYNHRFAGCLNIGVSDVNLYDYSLRRNVPFHIRSIPANIWYVSGNEIRQNSQLLRLASSSLDWLRAGDYISLELTPNKTLNVLFNSEDVNIQFCNVPNNVYVIVELQGSTIGIQTTSSSQGRSSPLRPSSLRLQDSVELSNDPLQKQDSMLESIDFESLSYEFSEICGTNICLLENRRTAERQKSYNNALVFVSKPLFKGDSISITVDTVNAVWKGSLGLGVVGVCPQANNGPLPISILQCKRPCWVTTHDHININGMKSMSKYGEVLENVTAGTVITITLTHNGMLVITVGSTSLEDLASGILSHVYPVFDVYGKCERISIIGNQAADSAESPAVEAICAAEQPAKATRCEKADLEVYEKQNEVQASSITSGETSSICPS